jgi:UDP-3-O-[3-hydroxymyristoyl] glucosamine N-acyltransferase
MNSNEINQNIGENVKIHPSSSIDEGAKIGKNVEIGNFVLIEDDVVIGDNTHIGPFSIIRTGARIGSNCKFTAYCEIRDNVKVGDNTTMGSRCTISANAEIGSNVALKYSFVLTDTPNLSEGDVKSVGKIGDGSLIGANVCLMPGFSIGKSAIIGACSQVRSNVGDNEIWYGSPAKFFKRNE